MEKLIHGDCLEIMQGIADKSIDMILCDLPYECLNKGNRNAQWDKQIPFNSLWEEYERIIKDNGAIVLFSQGMFTAHLMMSNTKIWRYNLIWKKGNRPTGFLNAKRMPLRNHEDICVFYKELPTYNPQMTLGDKCHTRNTDKGVNRCYGNFKMLPSRQSNEKFPISVIDIPKEHSGFYHPTQKPVALLEYLIKTYTNSGETVLDNCMGSGSTGVACKNTGRDFIGIELDDKYFDIAKKRIEEHTQQKGLF